MTIIVSVGEHGEIGRAGGLCWHIPADLKHFKELTMGCAVVMGRKTWESLPRRPLPGRLNIVVTSNPDALRETEGALAAASLQEALLMARKHGREIFIIGGESLYRQALPLAERLELTRVMDSDPEADTFFPEISTGEWVETNRSDVMESPDGVKFFYATYENSRRLP